MQLYLRLHVQPLQFGEDLPQVEAVFGQDEHGTVHGREPNPGLALSGYIYVH